MLRTCRRNQAISRNLHLIDTDDPSKLEAATFALRGLLVADHAPSKRQNVACSLADRLNSFLITGLSHSGGLLVQTNGTSVSVITSDAPWVFHFSPGDAKLLREDALCDLWHNH